MAAAGGGASSVDLESIDPATSTAEVTAPADVATGLVYLEVNGKRSPSGVLFKLASSVKACGDAHTGGAFHALADDSLLVYYYYYGASGSDPDCPAGSNGIVLRQSSDGPTAAVWRERPWTEWYLDSAVDNTGKHWVIASGIGRLYKDYVTTTAAYPSM